MEIFSMGIDSPTIRATRSMEYKTVAVPGDGGGVICETNRGVVICKTHGTYKGIGTWDRKTGRQGIQD